MEQKLEFIAHVLKLLATNNLNEPFTSGQVTNALSDSSSWASSTQQ